MEGEAEIPFVRHSVQRERQPLADQRMRLDFASCKNRGALAVPDQDGSRAPGGGRMPGQEGAVGVRQLGLESRRGTNGPAGLGRREGPAAVPYGFDAGFERERRDRAAPEFTGLAQERGRIASRLQPCAADRGGKGPAGTEAVKKPVETVRPGRAVPSSATD